MRDERKNKRLTGVGKHMYFTAAESLSPIPGLRDIRTSMFKSMRCSTSCVHAVVLHSRQLLLHCSTFARPWARTSCIHAVVRRGDEQYFKLPAHPCHSGVCRNPELFCDEEIPLILCTRTAGPFVLYGGERGRSRPVTLGIPAFRDTCPSLDIVPVLSRHLHILVHWDSHHLTNYRGFDKIVWNDFEQHRICDAGPVGVAHREVRHNPNLLTTNKERGLMAPFFIWRRERPLSPIPGLRGICASLHYRILTTY